MTNDKVSIDVYPDRASPDRFRGDVTEILERALKKVVGVLHMLKGGKALLTDDGHSWGEDLLIENFNGFKPEDGDLVAVEITQYPSSEEALLGKVVDVIGDSDDPLNDIKRVLFANSIPQEFSKKALQETSNLTEFVDEKDIKPRTDLRHLEFVTIDGVTAKDFDDAIFVEKARAGFKLWVAIADVSHYVKPGTALDDEAYERGTSTYFPGHCVPMLPEVISNGLCSLNPHLPRLVLVAEISLDFHGEVQGYKFHEAVIESKSRVTYGEAQDLIDGVDVEKHRHVKDAILRAADLAKILMAKRFDEGSLDLEIPETDVQVNELGVPVDIIRSERVFAHRLIEEMMLIANVCAARFLNGKDVGTLFRIHEPPKEDSIALLERFLHNFGGKTQVSGANLQKKITKALEEFADTPKAQVLNILTLRSMNQAKYSPNNVGHFGLAFENYAHFTSPIRRYPDLVTHRQIKTQIETHHSYELMGEGDLDSAGAFLSACEQRSVKAERQLISIKKARFMQNFLGEEYEGVISSVAKFGVFVLLRKFDVDGRVALEDLGNDKWEFDEERLALVGKKSGFTYNIGDPIKVTVANVDIDEGKVDFTLGESPPTRDELKALADDVNDEV